MLGGALSKLPKKDVIKLINRYLKEHEGTLSGGSSKFWKDFKHGFKKGFMTTAKYVAPIGATIATGNPLVGLATYQAVNALDHGNIAPSVELATKMAGGKSKK